jgi:hypothetical protein
MDRASEEMGRAREELRDAVGAWKLAVDLIREARAGKILGSSGRRP